MKFVEFVRVHTRGLRQGLNFLEMSVLLFGENADIAFIYSALLLGCRREVHVPCADQAGNSGLINLFRNQHDVLYAYFLRNAVSFNKLELNVFTFLLRRTNGYLEHQ